jgi:DNA-directed RNA polymerase subunit K/omega
MFRFDLISKGLEKQPNKFLLVHLLAKRMHQLADGANTFSSETHKSYFNNALQEFLDDSLNFKESSRLEDL